MITCIIIDDERRAGEALGKILERYFNEKIRVVFLADSVKEGVAAIHKHNPELVFLDIEMPVENGFALFDYFTKYPFEVIFTTAYQQYAIEAIKYAALDYLLKPVTFIELRETLKRFEEKQQAKNRQERIETLLSNLNVGDPIKCKLALPTMYGYQMENINNIVYCEADQNYTNIHMASGEKILVARTLKYVEELLPDELFFRIHKSFLVNLNYVKKYLKTDGHQVILEDNTILDIANRRNEEFVQALTQYKPVPKN